ncbi:kinase-like protein [Sodiomyces alkalinus F11]|uniref:Kinase-like protein n=1 Tax=Sodiomyces alkalinus (strain CBS 110278 / VKM F-3762 / F11) TaxID=1314773 RepID=A0A3N2PLK3_SODAK|nr:kinase-like protein [Sodiomyces alkalinus F11]ROT35411.1 kinase-like protein [Sodiomyces alkalinus F11]
MADSSRISQVSGSGSQPLRSALKSDDGPERPHASGPASSSSKVVQIVASPEPLPNSSSESQLKRQYSANVANKRLGGRPTMPPSAASSRTSLNGLADQAFTQDTPDDISEQPQNNAPNRKQQYVSQKLLSQVYDWLEHEQRKKETRGNHQKHHQQQHDHHHHHLHLGSSWRKQRSQKKENDGTESEPPHSARPRSDSVDSQTSDVDLDKLQRILEENMSAMGLDSIPTFGPRRSSISRHKRLGSRTLFVRNTGSDTDYVDGDVVVPACDAVLDNTKTLSYNSGRSSTNLFAAGKAEAKEKEAWETFRNEIIRLARTLRIKGWRRVPLSWGDRISVQRLSGALTNSVYVVTPPPPQDLEPAPGKKAPSKLLLRIYGPQVGQLIDREQELSVLKRLARKKIGPRLLGTFTNGRFEHYFNSTTLTPANLREPETYRQIAKRMRELHDGVEILESERAAGPAVWCNWDRWLANVEKMVVPLDEEAKAKTSGNTLPGPSVFRGRGFVCGTEWPKFKAAVEKYRQFLVGRYKDAEDINWRLVFAHNDTQYGNILRIRPDDEKSPLLQPANEHKQLIVIDFEYAAANLPGLEFANHFTEWCYNYHGTVPHACKTERYPMPEDQRRFIKAYVDHRPQFPHSGSTPRLTPLDTPTSTPTGGNNPALHATGSTSSIVDFMLDARVPAGQWREEERQQEEATEKAVTELMEETRLWRAANSAQWVAWGIVQAKIPGVDVDGGAAEAGTENDSAAAIYGANGEKEEEEEEFDYLRYAQDRALFFWGDCIQLGLVKVEELPDDIRDRVKYVDR